MDLTFENERLNRQFAGRISTEAVTKCLEDTATSIGKGRASWCTSRSSPSTLPEIASWPRSDNRPW